MISTALARALRDSGLVWKPRAGDAFRIDLVEADDDLFVLSDMTVEAHEFSTGTVLGFNGTTEWALDSVALDEALWHPHESQLREALGRAFVSLTAIDGYTVTATIEGVAGTYVAAEAADAYAKALLMLLDSLAGG